MKKHTKFVSLVLAVMMAVSTFAGIAVFPVSAADDEQIVYFRFPDESVWTHEGLKVNGRTAIANVYCYAYAIYGNTHKYQLGWKTRTTQCRGVDEGNGLVNTTLFYFNLADSAAASEGGIEEGADYGIIFSTAAAGQNQTCDVNLSTECIGDTVIVTPYNGEVDRENAADSHKRDHYAAWLNHSAPYGPKATISSLGALMPGYFPANQPRAQQLSNALKQYLTNPTNNPYFQYANNMVLCEALGVTPQQVYDQYMKDNADNIVGDAETDDKVPCPFYRYMYTNDQGQEVEGKLAAPDYVKEVLGITDEEPTTEEPTTEAPTEPTAIEEVTVYTDETIAVGYPVPNSQRFYHYDTIYGIKDVEFTGLGGDFEYGKEYTLSFVVEPMEGFALTDNTSVNLVLNEDSVAPVAVTKELNDDGTITATFTYAMPEEPTEEPTTEEPTTEEPTTEEPTTEPVVADTFTVAGSSVAIFNGAFWDATAAANDLTFNEETGLYEITYTDVQPEDAINLKVVKNHGWDESYPEENYAFNVKEACDITVTYNPETNEVKVTGDGVTVDDDLIVEHVIAVGNGEDTYLNGANWDPSDISNEMTKIADGIYEITMEDIYAFDNYNIKFAINSIDADGNPTSNPWAYNFGAEVEQMYPVNEVIDAVYNGQNAIFEVEEDESTVTIQLDLRNFDFATKQGAKFTITVTAPDPQTEGIIGDVNGDGVVTVLDATLIQKYSVELPVDGPFNNKLADVNNDGVITILDASCIQRYAAEMTKKTGNAGVAYEDITPASENPDIVR